MWPFTKKKDVDKVSVEIKEAVGLADPDIYTDSELAGEVLENLESGYFKPSPVFDEYINNPDNRGVSRRYVENEIRQQQPNDRKFWSLTLNPFLERP